MNCTCCNKQKVELKPVKSRLNGQMIYMCSDCIKAKREPRFIIVLTARMSKEGLERATEYVVGGRYVGEPILGKEILVR